MNTYLNLEGRELSLTHLSDGLTQTYLALRGLHVLIDGTLNSAELSESEVSRLTVAHLALKALASQTERLIPDWSQTSLPEPDRRGAEDNGGS